MFNRRKCFFLKKSIGVVVALATKSCSMIFLFYILKNIFFFLPITEPNFPLGNPSHQIKTLNTMKGKYERKLNLLSLLMKMKRKEKDVKDRMLSDQTAYEEKLSKENVCPTCKNTSSLSTRLYHLRKRKRRNPTWPPDKQIMWTR